MKYLWSVRDHFFLHRQRDDPTTAPVQHWNGNQTRAESCGRCHQCSLLNVWRKADVLLLVLHKRSLNCYSFSMFVHTVMYKKLISAFSGLLQHYYIPCNLNSKPLILLHFLHTLRFSRVLCFANSRESSHRWVTVFDFKIWIVSWCLEDYPMLALAAVFKAELKKYLNTQVK